MRETTRISGSGNSSGLLLLTPTYSKGVKSFWLVTKKKDAVARLAHYGLGNDPKDPAISARRRKIDGRAPAFARADDLQRFNLRAEEIDLLAIWS